MPTVEDNIVINAPRDVVLAIAQDNEKFPEFMTDVYSLKVTEKSPDGTRVVSEWVGIVPKFGNKISWVEEDRWNLEQGTCIFKQITGDYDQFEGMWKFTSQSDSTTLFEFMLEYRLEIPLVGPLIKTIIHKTMQNNAKSTLEAIKKRAEEAQVS